MDDNMNKTKNDQNNGSAGNSPNTALASHYALHVALQTMKERCQALQQRLNLVEEENLDLRMKVGTDNPVNDKNKTDVDSLTEKVGELTRQKFQLTEHIAMVATENRQLWSRLSKLTKDNQHLENSFSKIKDTISNATASNNLIRSKTFTQNSPNPILRLKKNDEIPPQALTADEENISLEEISLKVLNEFLEGKAEVEKKCTEILATTPSTAAGTNSFGFGYLNDDASTAAAVAVADTELSADVKKCGDQMVYINKELRRQQSDLKVAISNLRQRRGKPFVDNNSYLINI